MSMLVISLLLASPQVECQRMVPGTNEPLPQGINLSLEQELLHRIKCYCSRVKQEEASCLAGARTAYEIEQCKLATVRWVQTNLALPRQWQNVNVVPTPIMPAPTNLQRTYR